MKSYKSLYRYAGGKSKLLAEILPVIDSEIESDMEYREPFFGGGSVGIAFIQKHPHTPIWINDKDAGVASIWTSVIQCPGKVKQHVKSFNPVTSDFYTFKSEMQSLCSVPYDSEQALAEIAFKKIALHQISYSGLGIMSGGPLGGDKQESDYKIDCRWNADNLCQKIDYFHSILTHVRENRCTSEDFETVICYPGKAYLYLDPPYYVKGSQLYLHGFTDTEHKRLSIALSNTTSPWLLSYDDCTEIRHLYDWACCRQVAVSYSINTATVKPELLITPNPIEDPYDIFI